MSRSDDPTTSGRDATVREYVLDDPHVEAASPDGDLVYRFEAPQHRGIEFEDAETAELYAGVYFDVNGFAEAGTGEQGVPREIILAGRDTFVAYLLTLPETDVRWLASYYGEKPEKIERYVNRVRKRAERIRRGAADRGVD